MFWGAKKVFPKVQFWITHNNLPSKKFIISVTVYVPVLCQEPVNKWLLLVRVSYIFLFWIRPLVFSFEWFHIFKVGAYVVDNTEWVFLIVEGRTLTYNYLVRRHLNIVDSFLIGNHTRSPYFYIKLYDYIWMSFRVNVFAPFVSLGGQLVLYYVITYYMQYMSLWKFGVQQEVNESIVGFSCKNFKWYLAEYISSLIIVTCMLSTYFSITLNSVWCKYWIPQQSEILILFDIITIYLISIIINSPRLV